MAKKNAAPTKSQIITTIAEQADLTKKRPESLGLNLVMRNPC